MKVGDVIATVFLFLGTAGACLIVWAYIGGKLAGIFAPRPECECQCQCQK
jgi:hypothetical protein